MSHTHDIIDTGNRFVINPELRTITTKSSELILTQGDHNSKRYTFEVPRIVEGHDMTLCNRIEVHYDNISRDKKDLSEGFYVANDLKLDGDNITFSWLISGNVTRFAGTARFWIVFICLDDNNELVYSWGTDIFKSVKVIANNRNTEEIIDILPDVIEHLKQEVTDVVDEKLEVIDQWKQEIVDVVDEKLETLDQFKQEIVDVVDEKLDTIDQFKQEVTDAVDEFKQDVADVMKELDAEKIVFPDGLNTTYEIGNVKLENGMGTLVKPGGTLKDFFNVFIDEKNPTITQPSVSLSFPEAKSYEVGTYITPTYSATFNPGSYSYDPDTGVKVESWTVSDSEDNTVQTASGEFPKIQVTDDFNYTITAKATHSAGIVPKTNMGNRYSDGQIAKGSKERTSGAATGYRKTFYGTRTTKDTLDSDKIRGLSGKSTSALKNGSSFTVSVPVGALLVVIAYPDKLRDLTSVKDDTLGIGIESGFEKNTVEVAGDNGYNKANYKVYVLEFANPNDTANTYTVTI